MLKLMISGIISKLLCKAEMNTNESRITDKESGILDSDQICLSEKIFDSEAEVEVHLNGYSDGMLNEYIIAKYRHWLQQLRTDEFIFPPHVYSTLCVIQLVQARIGRPLYILDFGGGAPIIPKLTQDLGLSKDISKYIIVESPAFLGKVPEDWRRFCEYTDAYDGEKCDLLVLSGVLPYLSKPLVQSVYKGIKKTPPLFLYFGRTSFLPETDPHEELFTIQESKFREHGVQVNVNMADIEDNVARYSRRHFKWSEVKQVIDPLGYKRIMSLVDDSGLSHSWLKNITGLGLYTNNSLWELRG